MTLTELLASVRRVEVRTNRRVNASADGARLCEPQPSRLADHRNSSERAMSGKAAAGRRPALRSLQPAAERVRIPAGMPDGQHTDFIALHREVNPAFETRHPRLANNGGFLLEKFGILFHAFKQHQKFGVAFLPQARLPFLIPFQSLKVIQVGGRFEPHALHFRRCKFLSVICFASFRPSPSGVRRSEGERSEPNGVEPRKGKDVPRGQNWSRAGQVGCLLGCRKHIQPQTIP